MMSPMVARPTLFKYPPYQTMTTFTPATSRPQAVHRINSRRWANNSLRSTEDGRSAIVEALVRKPG